MGHLQLPKAGARGLATKNKSQLAVVLYLQAFPKVVIFNDALDSQRQLFGTKGSEIKRRGPEHLTVNRCVRCNDR